MNLLLKNLMEDIVIQNVNNIIGSLDVCTCEECRLDIMSYTLNRLPPKYTATTQGELMAKLDSLDKQFEATIIATITKAAAIVKDHPRHKQ